jgi:hypothetical protein
MVVLSVRTPAVPAGGRCSPVRLGPGISSTRPAQLQVRVEPVLTRHRDPVAAVAEDVIDTGTLPEYPEPRARTAPALGASGG